MEIASAQILIKFGINTVENLTSIFAKLIHVFYPEFYLIWLLLLTILIWPINNKFYNN